MLGRGAATVGSQEGNCGGEVGAGIRCEPGEAANQGLISFVARNESQVFHFDCCRLDGIDGAPGLVWRGERIEVDVCQMVSLDNILGVHLLGRWTESAPSGWDHHLK